MKNQEGSEHNEAQELEEKIEQLKNLLLQSAPIWIDGIDFFAFNYGDDPKFNSMAGRDSVVSSEFGSAIIDRQTGEWEFVGPHLGAVNVSHVPKYDKVKIDLTFEQVRNKIQKQ